MAGKFLDSLGLAHLMSLLDKRYNGGSVSGGGVVDVSALPTILWGGSTLPTDSSTVVDYLYFNTELSVQEVVDILSSANLSMISTSFGDATRYVLTCPVWSTGTTDYDTSEHSYSIYYSASYDVWIIANVLAISSAMTGTAVEGSKIIFASKQVPDFGIAFEGWNHDITYPVAFGMPTFDISCAYTIPTQHNKLSTLVSTTAFTRIPFNENLIYRLEHKTFVDTETIYVGDIVPNSGTVDTIYFNMQMTVDDVVAVLSKLPYTEPHFFASGGTCYYIAVHTTSPWNNGSILHVIREYNSDNYMIVYCVVDASNNVEQIPLFSTKSGKLYIIETMSIESSFIGWNPEFSGSLVIDTSVLPADNGYTVGNYNYLISTLVATSTNFTDEIIYNDKYNYSYTYHTCKNGIWTQLSDTYNPQVFTEVDELPKGDWVGTAVPVGSYVEKIYFNTALSVDETVSILQGLTYTEGLNAIFANSDSSVVVYALNDGSVYAIIGVINAAETLIFASQGVEGTSIVKGWSLSELEINDTGINESEGIPIGTENNLISDLSSITPFVKGEVNDKYVYKLKEPDKTHKEGTLLVSNPDTLVEKVTFNTDLSVEEVTNILSQLTYTTFSIYTINVLYSNSNQTHILFALNPADGDYRLLYSTSLTDTSQAFWIFGNTVGGWRNTSDITINDTGITEFQGLTIGAENDKLTQVISMNADFKTVVSSFKYTYHAYNGKEYVRLDNSSSEETSKNAPIIISKTASSTYTFTQEEYELMRENNNVIISTSVESEDAEMQQIYYKTGVFKYAQNEIIVFTTRSIILGESHTSGMVVDGVTLEGTTVERTLVTSLNSLTYNTDATSKPVIQLAYNEGGDVKSIDIKVADEVVSGDSRVITSGAVYSALLDKLTKEHLYYSQDSHGFNIGDYKGATGDRSLHYDAYKHKWLYCDVADEDELTSDDNEIVTIGEVRSAISNISPGTPGTSTTPAMVEITYADLVNLRDTSSLVPGQQYKIIDYVCTVSADIPCVSAEHGFDIIVTADSADTLNTNARASVKPDDTYFQYISNAIDIPVIGFIMEDDEFGEYKDSDVFMAYGYAETPDGYMSPAIYKTDITIDPDVPDYEDAYFYYGTIDIDGVEYQQWRKAEQEHWGYEADTDVYVERYAVTTIIVEGGVINNGDGTIDQSNCTFIEDALVSSGNSIKYNDLSKWELKYSLDNDTRKYTWAHTNGKGVIFYMKDDFGNECGYDFKNILFMRTPYNFNEAGDLKGACVSTVFHLGHGYIYTYTFSYADSVTVIPSHYKATDASLNKTAVMCAHNRITPNIASVSNDSGATYSAQILNNIVFMTTGNGTIHNNFIDSASLDGTIVQYWEETDSICNNNITNCTEFVFTATHNSRINQCSYLLPHVDYPGSLEIDCTRVNISAIRSDTRISAYSEAYVTGSLSLEQITSPILHIYYSSANGEFYIRASELGGPETIEYSLTEGDLIPDVISRNFIEWEED